MFPMNQTYEITLLQVVQATSYTFFPKQAEFIATFSHIITFDLQGCTLPV